MREAGMRNVETYSTYSPDRYPAKQTEQRNLPFAASRYLGPRTVIDALSGHDAQGVSDPSAIKRFFQEQTVGLASACHTWETFSVALPRAHLAELSILWDGCER